MAIVTRYFSTSAAGAGDGTTWADRAQLVNGSTWSSVITGFNFSAADTLLCLVGPGTHTAGEALVTGSFANPPTVVNRLLMHGCDASGNRLFPANLGWSAAQPAWDASGLPVITTTTNVATWGIPNSVLRLLTFTTSGSTSSGIISSAVVMDWCNIVNNVNGANTFSASTTVGRISNCLFTMAGASFRSAVVAQAATFITNTKFINTGGSGSGIRRGIEQTGSGSGTVVYGCCIVGFTGAGIGTSSAIATGCVAQIRNCVFAGNGTGIALNATASQTLHHHIEGCLITGNTVAGINGQTNASVVITRSRLRDNNAQNIINATNCPTDWDLDTSAGVDATEFADSANGDYRVKYGSLIWGKGYGVSDQPGGFQPLVGGLVI